MKVFYINVYHLLPEDFDGDVNDALRELIKYRESNGLTNAIGAPDSFSKLQEATIFDTSMMMWSVFLKKIKEGFKTIGAISLGPVRHKDSTIVTCDKDPKSYVPPTFTSSHGQRVETKPTCHKCGRVVNFEMTDHRELICSQCAADMMIGK